MAGSTTTTLNDLLPQIVSEAMFVANERSVMKGLVRNFNLPANSGKTITVPIYPTQSVGAAVTEGDEVGNTAVSTDGQTITIETFAIRSLVTDLAVASSASNVVADLGRLFGEAMAKKIDQNLLALFSGFATGVGDNATALSAATIAKGVATLRANSVPQDALACVVHPYVGYDLKANLTNTFVNPNPGIIQNEAMAAGYLGTLFGVPVFESANIADTGTAGDYVGGIFHRDALGLAMIGDINIETDRRASFVGTDVVASSHFGVKELYDGYGVAVTADSSLVNP